MAFTTPYDIANRAAQLLGVTRIVAFTDSSKQAVEFGFAYDKVRRAELRRSVWGCATRRAVLRKITSTTKRLAPPTYAAGTTYAIGDIVADSAGFLWISNIASNIGNTPGVGGANPAWSAYYGPIVADAWSSSLSYFPGDVVYESTTAYLATAATTNVDPGTDAGAHWHPLTGAPTTRTVFSPIGYSPDGSVLRTLYRLPNNFLRIAPVDPKAAGSPRQNVTAGMPFNDWEIEAGHLTSASTGPIVLRFVADLTDVSAMDDMLCESIAASLALATCETLTQSPAKKTEITNAYNSVVASARMVNAIEAGSTENEPQTPIAAAGGVPAGQGG